jgi:hypothetical protein
MVHCNKVIARFLPPPIFERRGKRTAKVMRRLKYVHVWVKALELYSTFLSARGFHIGGLKVEQG